MGEQKTAGMIGITGSTGFIGSHLTSFLKNNSIPFAPFLGDIQDIGGLREFFQRHDIETLIHLVGSFSSPFENLLEKNVLLTNIVLEEAVAAGLKHIVYASSGAVYGNSIDAKETDVLSPVSLYGLSKIFGEDVVRYFSPRIVYTILRFPNVYDLGGGNGVISLFLNEIKKSKQVSVEGDGSQKRQFLHVSDACRAILRATDETTSDVYNIAHPRVYTISEIVAILKMKYVFHIHSTLLSNSQSILSMNTSKAEKKLRFGAKIDLESFLLSVDNS